MSGGIYIKGRSISDYTLDEVRQMISYVPQSPYLFNVSIEENIRYSNINARREDVIRAARLANIHDFIMSLPEGYDTVVG